jgi:hypothetical protein
MRIRSGREIENGMKNGNEKKKLEDNLLGHFYDDVSRNSSTKIKLTKEITFLSNREMVLKKKKIAQPIRFGKK